MKSFFKKILFILLLIIFLNFINFSLCCKEDEIEKIINTVNQTENSKSLKIFILVFTFCVVIEYFFNHKVSMPTMPTMPILDPRERELRELCRVTIEKRNSEFKSSKSESLEPEPNFYSELWDSIQVVIIGGGLGLIIALIISAIMEYFYPNDYEYTYRFFSKKLDDEKNLVDEDKNLVDDEKNLDDDKNFKDKI